MKSPKRLFHLIVLFLSIFLVTFGFNTLDQMINRYKFYDDFWRTSNYWELTYFLVPRWWDAFILSIISLILAGFLLGFYIRTWVE